MIGLTLRAVVTAPNFAISQPGLEGRRDLEISPHLQDSLVWSSQRRKGKSPLETRPMGLDISPRAIFGGSPGGNVIALHGGRRGGRARGARPGGFFPHVACDTPP